MMALDMYLMGVLLHAYIFNTIKYGTKPPEPDITSIEECGKEA